VSKPGVYQSVDGMEDAAAVPGIEEVIVTAKPGQHFLAPPDRTSYPGFIFARGESPAQVEGALRQSHAKLRFHMAMALHAFAPGY
jgi:hypothetical protein